MLPVNVRSEKARLPTRGSRDSAGLDLYAATDVTIKANSTALLPLGISVSIPRGFYGQIASRSGLATKGLVVEAGVIDSDYRGEIKVLLYNHSHSPYEVKVGDRVAQLIIIPVLMIEPAVAEALEETLRGESGFGSTGE